MALGTFHVTIDGERLGGTAETTAVLRVAIQGRSAIKDEAADRFIFPSVHAGGASVSLPYTLDLPTDVAAGAGTESTELGFEVTVTTHYGGRVVAQFAARPADETIALTDLAETVVTPVSDMASSVAAAQAAQEAAETAAASVPSEAELSATYVARAAGTSATSAPFHTAERLLSNFQLIGVDNSGRGYVTNNASGLFQSDNGMPDRGVVTTDRTGNKGIPAGSDAAGPVKIVEFGGMLYLLTSTGGTPEVWRAARSDGNTAFAWTKVHTMRAGSGITGFGTMLNTDGTYLYAGEYGDPTGGPCAYRSSDGTTWETVWGPIATERHIHAINPDPYNPGHVWMTVGDGGNHYVLRSTNSGASGSWVDVAPDNAHWQSVQISFDPDHVWFASDNRFSTCMVYDRATGTMLDATPNTHRHISVPGAIPRNGPNRITDAVFNGTKTMTSATAAFTTGDLYREVHHTSLPEGRSWISNFNSATSVELYEASTASSSGNTVVFSDEQFRANPIQGAVDPDSGVYYTVSTLGAGQRTAFFYTAGVGMPVHLLDPLAQIALPGFSEVMFWHGYAWCGIYRVRLR